MNIAVIDSDSIHTLFNGRVIKMGLPFQPLTHDDLVALAHMHEVEVLWVAPGSLCSQLVQKQSARFTSPDDRVDVRASTTREGVPTWVYVWRKEGTYQERNAVQVGFPEYDPRWPWQSCNDAPVLLRSILSLQDALDAPVVWSPGHVGRDLMEHLNSESPRVEWVKRPALPDVVCQALARDLTWKKPIVKRGKYLYVVDKRSMYLGACTSAYLGEGECVHFTGQDASFNPKWPGVWHIPHLDAPRLGHPAWEVPPVFHAHRGWVWTPEVEVAQRLGYQLKIDEAYIWPKYHQTLRSWGERLWHARETLEAQTLGELAQRSARARQAYQMSYDAVKMIATQGMGWLAHKPTGGSGQWYRPDWWSMVVSEARAKMLYKVRQLHQKDIDVVWVNVDALGLVSDAETAEEVLDAIGAKKTGLGAYKLAYRVNLTDEVLGLFEDSTRFNVARARLLELAKEGE